MNTMGNLARGILLGDGGVSAYLDIFSNKELGAGLFQDTTAHSYRRKNFNKNNVRKSSYYHIQRELADTPIDTKRFLAGNLVSAYNVDGIPIGYAYTTDINFNSLSRGYASSADFNELQKLLRIESLNESQNGDENEFTINRYTDVKSFSDTINGISSVNRGDEYKNRLENYRRTYNKIDSNKESKYYMDNLLHTGLGNKFLEERKYQEGNPNANLSDYKFINKINNNKIDNHLSINEIAEKLKPSEYVINKIISAYSDRYKSSEDVIVDSHYGEYVDFYKKINKKNNGENKISFLFNNSELFEYYKDKRNSLLKGKKIYGISEEIGKKIEISKDIKKSGSYKDITLKDNGGSLRSFNYNNLVTSYNFFDEKDGDNEVLELSESNDLKVSQGSLVSIKSITNNTNASRLLQKTNELFKANKIKTLVNRFHTDFIDRIEENGNSELLTAKTEYGLSRGRNLLKSKENRQNNLSTNGYDNPYCRVWTAHHQYSKMEDRMRPFVDDDNIPISLESLHKNIGGNLRPNNSPERFNKYSTLQSNGFLRIAPTFEKKDDVIKNYMFSIENLAWKDFNGVLSKEQKGPNDGRIMWFPPYNLKFTENINVNWNANTFIGRGENIYTYTNTERAGTLSFTLLIDHPSILNTWRGLSEDYTGEILKEKEETMLRFFAGCEPLSGTTENDRNIENNNIPEIIPNKTPHIDIKKKRIAYVIFFPNNYTCYDRKDDFDSAIRELFDYEVNSDNNNWNENNEPDKKFKNSVIIENNYNKFSLNSNGGGKIDDIKTILLGSNDEYIDLRFLTDIASVDDNNNVTYTINNEDNGYSLFNELKLNADISNIEVYGFASSHGTKTSNMQLAKRRADFIKKLITEKCNFLDINVPILDSVTEEKKVNDIDNKKDMNTFDAKVARSAIIIFNINKKIDSIPVNEMDTNLSVNGYKKDKIEEKKINQSELIQKNEQVFNNNYSHDNEYLYFREMGENDYFIKNIVNRIKYFDPAFHSITPEGFNSRLTFLHQCTRQGPTTSVNGGSVDNNSKDYLKYAGNLSFGRAPYCVLRIGDFFNTKILIDSISIDYDNSGGTQWDLNPEGIGIQPMMANININLKFIGGQDISGPIERLQNAVTSNYYANASIYDKTSDYTNTENVNIRNTIARN